MITDNLAESQAMFQAIYTVKGRGTLRNQFVVGTYVVGMGWQYSESKLKEENIARIHQKLFCDIKVNFRFPMTYEG